jgi:hypothetical protein
VHYCKAEVRLAVSHIHQYTAFSLYPHTQSGVRYLARRDIEYRSCTLLAAETLFIHQLHPTGGRFELIKRYFLPCLEEVYGIVAFHIRKHPLHTAQAASFVNELGWQTVKSRIQILDEGHASSQPIGYTSRALLTLWREHFPVNDSVDGRIFQSVSVNSEGKIHTVQQSTLKLAFAVHDVSNYL